VICADGGRTSAVEAVPSSPERRSDTASPINNFSVLRDLAIIIGLAIPIVALTPRVRVPPLVGVILVGVVIGPHGVALIPEPEEVSALSEIGVVLLLFAIGIELSFSGVLRRGRAVIVTGGAQMVGR